MWQKHGNLQFFKLLLRNSIAFSFAGRWAGYRGDIHPPRAHSSLPPHSFPAPLIHSSSCVCGWSIEPFILEWTRGIRLLLICSTLYNCSVQQGSVRLSTCSHVHYLPLLRPPTLPGFYVTNTDWTHPPPPNNPVDSLMLLRPYPYPLDTTL
jgi:hypothetical protein